jgi:hypothetical protein
MFESGQQGLDVGCTAWQHRELKWRASTKGFANCLEPRSRRLRGFEIDLSSLDDHGQLVQVCADCRRQPQLTVLDAGVISGRHAGQLREPMGADVEVLCDVFEARRREALHELINQREHRSRFDLQESHTREQRHRTRWNECLRHDGPLNPLLQTPNLHGGDSGTEAKSRYLTSAVSVDSPGVSLLGGGQDCQSGLLDLRDLSRVPAGLPSALGVPGEPIEQRLLQGRAVLKPYAV